MKLRSPTTILSSLIVTIGLASSLWFAWPQLIATEPSTAAASAPRTVTVEEPRISGRPVHIAFSRVNVSVDVAPGHYDAASNTWTLSKDKAHFAESTAEPNNKTGTTFIYGHNRWQVFTALLSAETGDTATITTDNGHTFTYTLQTIADVEPTDLRYIQPTEKPTLTVQTCSGFNYEHRRMLIYELREVK